MNLLDRISYNAQRDSLFSILTEMEEKGYSMDEMRSVLDAGLASLNRYHREA